ncbi:OmpA family protein [Treponema sp.]
MDGHDALSRGFSLNLFIGLSIFAAFCSPVQLFAERFAYSYATGDKYRVLSTVQEDVYVGRTLSHRAEILNRIAITVTSVENGTGRHEATFQTSERSVGANAGKVFQWSREYDSVFDRDASGRYIIAKRYWMPVVRNVPLFPEADLQEGSSWTAAGEEVHDFRDSFGIQEPYRIPFMANYKFLGERELEGKKYPTFEVSYRIFEEPEKPAVLLQTKGPPRWPVRIMGASDQTVYWDRDLHQAAAYKETFRMIFELSDSMSVEYRGSAKAEIIEAAPMDRKKIADEINADLKKLGISDAGARVSDAGVSISLEDVQFRADSAELMQVERAKLDRIAQILLRYSDRDILVEGHTALAGNAAGRQKLSEERAGAVAEYLIGLGVRDAERVISRGYGAEKPIADNSSEEGRRRNRRVEITLLEN